jgi:hypothetical protein
MGLLLALGVFHCGAQNFDAIGSTADIDWLPAPIASEAYDHQRHWLCTTAMVLMPGLSPIKVLV